MRHVAAKSKDVHAHVSIQLEKAAFSILEEMLLNILESSTKTDDDTFTMTLWAATQYEVEVVL